MWQPEEDIEAIPENQIVKPNSLSYFVSQTNLKEVQEKFTSATGLGVVLVDPVGVQMTEPANLPTFCHYCSRHHGCCQPLSAERTNDCGLEWIKCEYGLIVARLPVRVQGVTVMYVLCGFALLGCPEQNEQLKAQELARKIGPEAYILLQSYNNIPLVTRNRYCSC